MALAQREETRDLPGREIDVVIDHEDIAVRPGFRARPPELEKTFELVEAAAAVVLRQRLLARRHVPADAAIPVALPVLGEESAMQGLRPSAHEQQIRPSGHPGTRAAWASRWGTD